MKFSSQFIATIAGVVTVSEAVRLNLCKSLREQECSPIDVDEGACTNLNSMDGRPYISGFTDGGTVCSIFEKGQCAGRSDAVDSAGWGTFPFEVWSIAC